MKNNFSKKVLFNFLKKKGMLGSVIMSLHGYGIYEGGKSNLNIMTYYAKMANKDSNSLAFRENMKSMLGATYRPTYILKDAFKISHDDYLYYAYQEWKEYIDENYKTLFKLKQDTINKKNLKNNSLPQ